MDADLTARLLAALSEAGDLSTVILHGSAATAAEHVASDVDVVVAAAQPLGMERLLELDALLGQRLGRRVDLRDLRRIEGLFLHRACESMDWVSDVLPAARSGQRRYLAAKVSQ